MNPADINGGNVEQFLQSIDPRQQREDCFSLLQMMTEITGEPARLWPHGIIGFGKYQYRYQSGRRGEWFLTGFAPRKQKIVIYIISGFSRYDEILRKLGKFTTGSSCLYVRNLSDINSDILNELVKESVEETRRKHT